MSTPKQPADLPQESTDPTNEPRTLGRYQLLAKIASGGMASVFLGRSGGAAGFEKLVAIKRIHPHLAEEKNFVEMFLDEARIASRIQHANVCSVFDFGEADGTYYIAMEYLVGEPFARVLKSVAKSRKHYEDPRHPYLVARAIADACEGLHAAHELRGRNGELLNVVHRDISPQNLFLTYEGNVKVVDFGIASAADRVHHTEGGEVKGKFSYMAPEQAKGAKGGKLDRRADVFALGIVLWEMLTLKRLFRRDTPAETLYALIGEDIPTPSSQRSIVPPELDPIVMKALSRNLDERYANTRELGRDLTRVIGRSGEPIGMADLAEWMERLLPEDRERAMRTVEAARSGDPATVQLVPSLAGDVSSSDVVPAESSKIHPRKEPTGSIQTRTSFPQMKADAPQRASLTPSGARPRKPSAPPIAPPPPPPPPEEEHEDEMTQDEGLDDVAPTTLHHSVVPPPVGFQSASRTGRGRAAAPSRAVTTQRLDAQPSRPPYALIASGAVIVLLLLVVGGLVAMKATGGSGGTETVAANDHTGGAPNVEGPPPHGAIPTAPTGPTPTGPTPTGPTGVVAPTGPTNPPPTAAGGTTDDGTDDGTRDPGHEPGDDGEPHGGTKTKHGPHGGVVRPPHPPAAGGNGFVQVVTPGGWANVFDSHGRALGQTPVRIELPAGHTTISLRPFGQPPNIRVDVDITSGQTARVSRAVN